MQLKKENRQLHLIILKTSYDVLFWLIISMILCLIVEAVIPGMVSGNNGFAIVLTMIFANIITISILTQKLNISFEENKPYKLMPFFIFFTFILLGNSLLKFSLIENLIITTSTVFFIVLLYKTIFYGYK